METDALVVLCTCPNQEEASELARCLVENRLAACVNIFPRIRSIYRWQGTVSDDAEVLMVIKTMASKFGGVEKWLKEHHPYDVPEVVGIKAASVAEAYLDWIEQSTTE